MTEISMPISTDELKKGVESLRVICDNDPKGEFEYRNYCSKSYYAVYHSVKYFVNDKHNFDQAVENGAYNGMGTHQKIITFLDEHIHIPSFNHNREYKKLVYRLKTMRQYRVNSDYYLDVSVNKTTYIQSETQYEGVMNIINSL